MSDYIRRDKAIRILDAAWVDGTEYQGYLHDRFEKLPPEDVQPVTFCKNCQLRADVKDVNTGEMYHTCGVLGFDVPDGFACNQGKRKGAGNEND